MRLGPVLGGAVLGFVSSWVVFAMTVFAVLGAVGDSGGRTTDVLAGVGLAGLPVVCCLLMIPRRTRLWGAGLLLGFTIGAITGAGVCGSTFALG